MIASPRLHHLLSALFFLLLFSVFAYRVAYAGLRLASADVTTVLSYEESAYSPMPSITVFRTPKGEGVPLGEETVENVLPFVAVGTRGVVG